MDESGVATDASPAPTQWNFVFFLQRLVAIMHWFGRRYVI